MAYRLVVSKKTGEFLYCQIAYFEPNRIAPDKAIRLYYPVWQSRMSRATRFYTVKREVRLACRRAGIKDFDIIELDLIREHTDKLVKSGNWRILG